MQDSETTRRRILTRMLSGVDRLILLMRYTDAMTLKEIALVLDLPESRVGTMLRRAKVRARLALADMSPAVRPAPSRQAST